METTLHGSGENRQKPQRIRDEGSRHTFERRTDAASLISVPLWEMRLSCDVIGDFTLALCYAAARLRHLPRLA